MSVAVWFPAITALIGAWVGAAFALLRFKSERAFDRRLVWYEQMTEHLNKLGATMEKVVNASDTGNVERVKSAVEEARQLFMPFAVTAGLRTVYAKQRGFEAVHALIHDIDDMGVATRTVAPGQKAQAGIEVFRVSKDKMWQVARVLSEEIREDMGWERLTWPERGTYVTQ